MSIQISVLYNTINFKSIDVMITDDKFKATDILTVTHLNTEITYDYIVLNEDKSIATIIFDDSNLLVLNESYIVTLNRGGTTTLSTNFTFEDVVSIEDSILVAQGTNFLTLTFPYPVNVIPSNPDTAASTGSPLFALPENLPIGTPNIHLSENIGFEWNCSLDLKTINIETLENPFNIGSISVFTNFPLTNNNLAGSYEKATDFSPLKRNLPLILSNTAQVPSVPKKITKIESAKYLYGGRLLVTFTNPILYLFQDTVTIEYNDIIYSTANTGAGENKLILTRPDYNNPTQLIYEIYKNGVAPEYQPVFAPGLDTVTLSSVLDANNNLTESATVAFKVPDQAPNVVSAQAPNENEILVTYDQIVNTTSPIVSALIADNYLLQSLPGTPAYTGKITNVSIETNSPTVVKLKLSDPLPLGSYSITVSNVVNLAGTGLDNNYVQFKFIDIIDTTVTILGYAPAKGGTGTDQYDPDPINHYIPTEGNKFVLTYNKAMITGTDAIHSADNSINYRILNASVNPPLVPQTNLGLVYPSNIINLYPNTDKVFRMTILPTTLFTPFILDNTKIEVGYAYREGGQYNLRTIRSLTGIDVLLNTNGTDITSWGTDIVFCNTDFGSMHLLMDGSIEYDYYQPQNSNKFYSINKENLLLYQDSTTNPPTPIESAELSDINGKSIIIFKFAASAIKESTKTIIVQEQVPGKSIIDIFGNSVIIENPCVFELQKDKILPKVLAASIVSIDEETTDSLGNPITGYNKVKVALFFNKKMMYTSDYDFVLSDNSFNSLQVPTVSILASKMSYPTTPEVPKPFELALVPNYANLNILTVEGLISNVNNSNNANLDLYTNLAKEQLSTEDINSNEMAIISPPMIVENLKGTTFSSSVVLDEEPAYLDIYTTVKYDRELSSKWTDSLGFAKNANGDYNLTATAKFYIDGREVLPGEFLPPGALVNTIFTITDSVDTNKIFGNAHSNFYAINAPLSPLRGPFDVFAKFTDDKLGIEFEIEKFAWTINIMGINLTTSYFVPAPYVLIDSSELIFVDTSYKSVALTASLS